MNKLGKGLKKKLQSYGEPAGSELLKNWVIGHFL